MVNMVEEIAWKSIAYVIWPLSFVLVPVLLIHFCYAVVNRRVVRQAFIYRFLFKLSLLFALLSFFSHILFILYLAHMIPNSYYDLSFIAILLAFILNTISSTKVK